MTQTDKEFERARARWKYRGDERPPFAVTPKPGQESVWDYPRPPALVADGREVVVRARDIELARTRNACRVLETASPPTFYLPPEDVAQEYFVAVRGDTLCEWKGRARYFDIVVGEQIRWPRQVWCYPHPLSPFQRLAGYFAFYPGGLECLVAGQRVRAQPGEYYGGWVTPDLVGPFKGEPGTGPW